MITCNYIVALFKEGLSFDIIVCSTIEEIKCAVIKLIKSNYHEEELMSRYEVVPEELYGNIEKAETIADIITIVYDVEFNANFSIKKLIKNTVIKL